VSVITYTFARDDPGRFWFVLDSTERWDWETKRRWTM